MTRPLRAVRLLAAISMAAALAAGCTSTSSGRSVPPVGAATATTAVAAAPDAPTAAKAPYSVGSRSLTFTDTTRPTKGDAKRGIAPAPSRTLPVLLLYPAVGNPGPIVKAVPGATPAEGRFPVVVFSHGVTASGPAYSALLAKWARQGYVVAAPTFPMTSGPGAWADLADYVNQPADVSFVLDRVLALGADAKDPIHGHLAAGAVAVAGHSLGAITTLGFLNSCCVDKRVRAAVAMSGVLMPFGTGTFDHPPDVPLLMIHGQKDATVGYKVGSGAAYARLPVPRALVTVPAGTHTSLFLDGGQLPSTDDSVVAFLDLELRHDDSAWRRLGATLDGEGVAWIEEAGGLPSSGPGGTKARPAG